MPLLTVAGPIPGDSRAARKRMRYAYIKYGDVVEELKKIGPAPDTIPVGGPATYIANFLYLIGRNPALLISWDLSGDRKRRAQVGAIKAYTYRRPRALLKLAAAADIFVRLIAFQPDVVLCVHDGPGLWAAFLACRLLRAPLLHSRQRAVWVEGDSWHKRVMAMIDGLAIRRAARVICHGPFARHQLIEMGVSESKIIEFSAHFDDLIAALRDTEAVKSEPQVSGGRKILFLGRVEESKGVLELFEACIPILSCRRDVDLIYVGNGGALPVLQQRAVKAGLPSRVAFAGMIPHDEVGKQLKTATVLVAPTRRGLEGWPKAVREGLAMGVPVIAPAAGPFPFIVEDGVNGLLYAADSVFDLQKKIERILDEPDLRQVLSRGAIDRSRRAALSARSFADALRMACAPWVD